MVQKAICISKFLLSSKHSSSTVGVQFNAAHATHENMSMTFTAQEASFFVLAGDWSTLHEQNSKYSLYKAGSERNESLSPDLKGRSDLLLIP